MSGESGHGASSLLVGIASTAGAVVIRSLLFWWSWDAAAVPLFHAPPVTFWLALGLSVLVSSVASAWQTGFKTRI